MIKTIDHGGNIIPYIRSVYPSLTKAEKKVADVVLKDGKQVIYDSLSDLAERSKVGDTTVLRFCRHSGYKGFQDFKLALALEVDREEIKEETTIDPNNIIKSANQTIKLINDTTGLLNEKTLSDVVQAFIKAKRITFFGVGSSGLTAQFAAFRMVRLGLPIESVTDSHLGMVKASLLTEEDVAVIISVSGSTVDIVEIAQQARKSGATIVCITSHVKSPVIKQADFYLLSASKEKPTEGSAFPSLISQLHILEVLFNDLQNELGEKGDEMIRLTAQVISQKLL